MKIFLILYGLLLPLTNLIAQSLARQAVAVGGDQVAMDGVVVSWTAGETLAGPLSVNELSLNQGFQQGIQPQDPNALVESPGGSQIRLYPNPTAGAMFLQTGHTLPAAGRTLSFWAADGKPVGPGTRLFWPAGQEIMEINLASLPDGHYFLRMDIENGMPVCIPFQKAKTF